MTRSEGGLGRSRVRRRGSRSSAGSYGGAGVWFTDEGDGAGCFCRDDLGDFCDAVGDEGGDDCASGSASAISMSGLLLPPSLSVLTEAVLDCRKELALLVPPFGAGVDMTGAAILFRLESFDVFGGAWAA